MLNLSRAIACVLMGGAYQDMAYHMYKQLKVKIKWKRT